MKKNIIRMGGIAMKVAFAVAMIIYAIFIYREVKDINFTIGLTRIDMANAKLNCNVCRKKVCAIYDELFVQ